VMKAVMKRVDLSFFDASIPYPVHLVLIPVQRFEVNYWAKRIDERFSYSWQTEEKFTSLFHWKTLLFLGVIFGDSPQLRGM
jgi:hypothetical protein